jgi:hypothetical protein
VKMGNCLNAQYRFYGKTQVIISDRIYSKFKKKKYTY